MNEISASNKLILNQQELMYDILPFKNPVCKQTYQSLPRIYGSKKTPKSKFQYIQPKYGRKDLLYPPKYDLNPDSLRGISRYLFPGTKKYNKQKSQLNGSSTGIRVKTQGNAQTYRQYNNSSSLYKRQRVKQTESSVKSFNLSDLQSSHKVNSQLNDNNQRPRPSSQLQKLLLYKKKLMPIMQFQKQQQNEKEIQKKLINSKNGHKLKAVAINTFNNSLTQINRPNQVLTKLPKRSFTQIQQQNQQELNQQVYIPQKPTRHTNSDTVSQSQRSALSLSRHVFNQKRDPTMFRNLERRVSSSKINTSRPSRISSSLDTGFFKIPQEKQYKSYIQKYQPMSEKFSLKQLLKNKNFKIIRQQKSVYFGQVNELDEKHGYGVSVSEKQIFEGQYQNNLKFLGLQRNIDGIYIGGYKEGVRFGQGTFKWNNGQVFLGEWKNGMKNGFGKWKAPQGHYYQGQWYQNRQHGQGYFKHHISTYKGQFKNFLKHGKGQQVFVNGDKYKGQYRQGKPEGQGRYQWDKGGYYQGQFKAGKRQGYGIWIDEDGTKYQGQFADDYKHGRGKQVYKTGQKFEGVFQYGSKANGKLYNKLNEQIEIVVK